jgi:hypothetical protein
MQMRNFKAECRGTRLESEITVIARRALFALAKSRNACALCRASRQTANLPSIGRIYYVRTGSLATNNDSAQ